ncbi:MAG: META domain-containing protein [Hyphomonas sp.]
MSTPIRHRHFIFPLFSLVALAGVSACTAWPGSSGNDGAATLTEAAMPTVTGSATYRERMMPPTGSVLNVTLSDTSRADAPAVRIAAWSASLDGKSVPQTFTLIPTVPMDPRMTYTVRATVNGPDGALLWTTDTVHRAQQSGAGPIEMGELVMVKVAAAPAAEPAGIDRDLIPGDWVVRSIGDEPAVSPEPLTLQLKESGVLNGFAGCNIFTGSFKHGAHSIHFAPLTTTLMACPDEAVNAQEAALMAALKKSVPVTMTADGALVLTGMGEVEVILERAKAFPALEGSAWKVTMMGGTAIVSGREPVLEFNADGKLGGSTGCNSFFGGYEQDAAVLSVAGLGSTKMMCIGEGVMEQEQAFMDILDGVSVLTLRQDGNLLTVKGEDGVSFTGERIVADAEPSDPALLTGAEWVVEDINRTGVIDNSNLTLTFGTDGRVSGSTNCNSFGGAYSVDGSKLTFTPLVMTRRACVAPALANQEQKYVSALSGEMDWKITSDGALELTGDEGRRVLLRR